MENEAATKKDLIELRAELKGDIVELRAELKADIAELRAELKGNIAELRTETHSGFDRLQEQMRDMQTEILRAFLPYQGSQNLRLRNLEANTANNDMA